MFLQATSEKRHFLIFVRFGRSCRLTNLFNSLQVFCLMKRLLCFLRPLEILDYSLIEGPCNTLFNRLS